MSHDSASQRLARLSDHLQGQTSEDTVMLERNFTSAGGATPALFGHVSMVRSPKYPSSPALQCRNQVQSAGTMTLKSTPASTAFMYTSLGLSVLARNGAITSISRPETVLSCDPKA